jgi:hypothetical protein
LQDTGQHTRLPLLLCRYNAALYHQYGATSQALAGYSTKTGGIAGKAPFSLSMQVCVIWPLPSAVACQKGRCHLARKGRHRLLTAWGVLLQSCNLVLTDSTGASLYTLASAGRAPCRLQIENNGSVEIIDSTGAVESTNGVASG